jgi:hypothetical protein
VIGFLYRADRLRPPRARSASIARPSQRESDMPAARRRASKDVDALASGPALGTTLTPCFPPVGGVTLEVGILAPRARGGAFKESARRAGPPYRKTDRGRRLHGARQARYRERRALVTHHTQSTPDFSRFGRVPEVARVLLTRDS